MPWGVLLTIGIFCIAAALGLIAFPWAPVGLVAVIIGGGFIAAGLSTLVLQRGAASVVGGLLLTLVGVFSIIFSDVLSSMLVTIAGIGILFVGALWLFIAVRKGASFSLLVSPVITIVAGIITLVWPTVALTFVAVVVGIIMMVAGWVLIRQALAFKRQPPTITRI